MLQTRLNLNASIHSLHFGSLHFESAKYICSLLLMVKFSTIGSTGQRLPLRDIVRKEQTGYLEEFVLKELGSGGSESWVLLKTLLHYIMQLLYGRQASSGVRDFNLMA